MIRFLPSHEIDYDKWNSCIDQSFNTYIFVYTWYLDAACDQWSALVMNDYEAVFPLAHSSKLTIKYLYQPFFTRHFGVFSKNNFDKNAEKEFFSAIPKAFQYLDFCLNPHHHSTPEKSKTEEKVFQELNLIAKYDELKKKYSENALRNIRRAEKHLLKITDDLSPSLLIKYFKQSQGEKLAYTKKQYDSLQKIMNACIGNANTYCLAVKDLNKKYLAGAFFMETNGRIIYLKGFSTEEGKKKGAMHFLFDQFIQSQSNQNKILDFGGSSVASVARFYKNFGATDCLYLHIHSNRLPEFIKWIKE